MSSSEIFNIQNLPSNFSVDYTKRLDQIHDHVHYYNYLQNTGVKFYSIKFLAFVLISAFVACHTERHQERFLNAFRYYDPDNLVVEYHDPAILKKWRIFKLFRHNKIDKSFGVFHNALSCYFDIFKLKYNEMKDGYRDKVILDSIERSMKDQKKESDSRNHTNSEENEVLHDNGIAYSTTKLGSNKKLKKTSKYQNKQKNHKSQIFSNTCKEKEKTSKMSNQKGSKFITSKDKAEHENEKIKSFILKIIDQFFASYNADNDSIYKFDDIDIETLFELKIKFEKIDEDCNRMFDIKAFSMKLYCLKENYFALKNSIYINKYSLIHDTSKDMAELIVRSAKKYSILEDFINNFLIFFNFVEESIREKHLPDRDLKNTEEIQSDCYRIKRAIKQWSCSYKQRECGPKKTKLGEKQFCEQQVKTLLKYAEKFVVDPIYHYISDIYQFLWISQLFCYNKDVFGPKNNETPDERQKIIAAETALGNMERIYNENIHSTFKLAIDKTNRKTCEIDIANVKFFFSKVFDKANITSFPEDYHFRNAFLSIIDIFKSKNISEIIRKENIDQEFFTKIEESTRGYCKNESDKENKGTVKHDFKTKENYDYYTKILNILVSLDQSEIDLKNIEGIDYTLYRWNRYI